MKTIPREILKSTVERLTMEPKGILAIDESFTTCNSRFEKLGVPTTVEKRREYRELLIDTPMIEEYISGYILFDETIRQSALDGRTFPQILKDKGIEVGIKVDAGTVDFPPNPFEKITQGLEGLEARLEEYKKFGATFAKWRAVYAITEHTPSEPQMKANAEIFAKYAMACQESGIVPIVEPEVLMDGNHDIEKNYHVTVRNLAIVFEELKKAGIYLPGMILKTGMILPGKDSQLALHDVDIVKMTVRALKEVVPSEVGGIVFLSGGQGDHDATSRLNGMHHMGPLPWPLTFSYGRAIQNACLKSWAAHPSEVKIAQDLLLNAARVNSQASVGQYK